MVPEVEACPVGDEVEFAVDKYFALSEGEEARKARALSRTRLVLSRRTSRRCGITRHITTLLKLRSVGARAVDDVDGDITARIGWRDAGKRRRRRRLSRPFLGKRQKRNGVARGLYIRLRLGRPRDFRSRSNRRRAGRVFFGGLFARDVDRPRRL